MRRVAVLLPILGQAGRVSTAQAAPDSTTVPMEVREGRAIVQVMLQGRGPYRLAVETGPPATLVSPAVAQALGLASTAGPAVGEQPAESGGRDGNGGHRYAGRDDDSGAARRRGAAHVRATAHEVDDDEDQAVGMLAG